MRGRRRGRRRRQRSQLPSGQRRPAAGAVAVAAAGAGAEAAAAPPPRRQRRPRSAAPPPPAALAPPSMPYGAVAAATLARCDGFYCLCLVVSWQTLDKRDMLLLGKACAWWCLGKHWTKGTCCCGEKAWAAGAVLRVQLGGASLGRAACVHTAFVSALSTCQVAISSQQLVGKYREAGEPAGGRKVQGCAGLRRGERAAAAAPPGLHGSWPAHQHPFLVVSPTTALSAHRGQGQHAPGRLRERRAGGGCGRPGAAVALVGVAGRCNLDEQAWPLRRVEGCCERRSSGGRCTPGAAVALVSLLQGCRHTCWRRQPACPPACTPGPAVPTSRAHCGLCWPLHLPGPPPKHPSPAAPPLPSCSMAYGQPPGQAALNFQPALYSTAAGEACVERVQRALDMEVRGWAGGAQPVFCRVFPRAVAGTSNASGRLVAAGAEPPEAWS